MVDRFSPAGIMEACRNSIDNLTSIIDLYRENDIQIVCFPFVYGSDGIIAGTAYILWDWNTGYQDHQILCVGKAVMGSHGMDLLGIGYLSQNLFLEQLMLSIPNIPTGDEVTPMYLNDSGYLTEVDTSEMVVGSADKLTTAREIELKGDVTGAVSFDGTANVSINAVVKNYTHGHQIADVNGLQTILNKKSEDGHTHALQTIPVDNYPDKTFEGDQLEEIIISADERMQEVEKKASSNTSAINNHKADTTVHITAAERAQWSQAEANQNAIGSFSIDGDVYYAPNTSAEVELHTSTLDFKGETTAKNGDLELHIDLPTQSNVTAGTYGPSANITAAGTAVKVPEVTVDAYGRVTKITNRTYNPNYVKHIAIDESSNLLPQLQYQKGDGTVVNVADIDYRVLQSKLWRYDSLSYNNIPLLLSSPFSRDQSGNTVNNTYYFPELAYNASSGYLSGVRIDCGTWNDYSYADECCFIAGTQILVDLNGTTKNIEDMVEGDAAIAYDLEKQENYSAIVKKTHIKEDVTDVAIVTFDDGTVLTMNAYHPIYTINGYHSLTNHKGYDTLVVGDVCRTENTWNTIINIERFQSEPIVMYSLDVVDIDEIKDNDINDNFFANGIVVHNAGCPT